MCKKCKEHCSKMQMVALRVVLNTIICCCQYSTPIKFFMQQLESMEEIINSHDCVATNELIAEITCIKKKIKVSDEYEVLGTKVSEVSHFINKVGKILDNCQQ